VAAVLAGDLQAADNVQLVLPETGICTTDFETDANGCCVTPIQVAASSCCGGPAPAEVDACCVADVVAKDAGKKGCGCGEAA
jgi:hypothetical protein